MEEANLIPSLSGREKVVEQTFRRDGRDDHERRGEERKREVGGEAPPFFPLL